MKKLGLLIAPLVAASFLTSCGEKEHFVTFESNGGDHVTTQRVKEGVAATLPTPEPKRDNDTFKGWFTDNETFEHEYTFADPVTEDITLYAKWEKATYTITFKNDGEVDQKIENIQPDSLITEKIPTPTTKKPGYDFIGWCTDVKGENVFDFETVKINQDYTLYAGWKEVTKHTISFKGFDCKAMGESIHTLTEAFQFISEEKDVTLTITPNDDFILDGKGLTFLVDGKETEPKGYVKSGNNYTLTFNVNGEILISIKAVKATEVCEVSFSGDIYCSMMYGDTVVDASGVKVNYSATNYVKFSIKVTQDTIIKPSDVTIKDGSGAIYTDYSFNKDNGDLLIKLSTPKLIVSAVCDTYKSLEEMTWSQIQDISSDGLSGFVFNIGDTKRVQLEQQDTNEDGADVISDGELYQTVRIIGFNHDVDSNGNKCGITFEFADLISDANGCSLATLWQDNNTTSGENWNYPNSTIRKTLVGEDNGGITWYEKGSNTHSTTYDGKTVYSMLPTKLQECLKTIRKNVWAKETAGGEWKETPVEDTLFLPSVKELNISESYSPTSDEEVYTYYEYAPQESKTIIKKQINTSIPFSGEPSITDITRKDVKNYAGYCYSNYGGYYWTRTGNKYETSMAQAIIFSGELRSYGTNERAYSIAPIFCI